MGRSRTRTNEERQCKGADAVPSPVSVVASTSASRPRLYLLGLEAVAGIGKARESRCDLERTGDPHRVERALYVEPLLNLDVDDLVGRRRRHVNAGTDERHEQEVGHPRRIEVERYHVA